MTTYEAMIITSTNEGGGSAWEGLKDYITQVIEGRGGRIETIEKWDERTLAYPIEKEKRAVYTLVHFEAGGDTVQQVRRDFTLSERILRVLVTVDEDEGRPDPMELLEGRKEEGEGGQGENKPERPEKAEAAETEKAMSDQQAEGESAES